MVWLTIIYIFVTAAMLIAIHRQGQIMMNAERPWLTVFIPKGETRWDDYRGLSASTQLAILYIMPAIKNYGKTIANAKLMEARPHLVPASEKLPSAPVYNSPETQILNGTITLFPDTPFQPFNLPLSVIDLQDIFSGKVVFWIYGHILYEDAFKRKHDARFCFIFRVAHGMGPFKTGFYVSAPEGYYEAYNRCT
jgi:hypothetical protein